MRANPHKRYDFVLVSQRGDAPMAKESLSRIVRFKLDEYQQENIRLANLRNDFIIRALRVYSWEYVSYISGVNLPSFQQHFLPHTNSKLIQGQKINYFDADVVRKLINMEGSSLEGLAIRLVWQLGVSVTILPTLTWDVVDWENSMFTAENRSIRIPDDLLGLLLEAKNQNWLMSNNILITNNKKKLSFVVKNRNKPCGISVNAASEPVIVKLYRERLDN